MIDFDANQAIRDFFGTRTVGTRTGTRGTPMIAKPADLKPNERGTTDGINVFMRHSCGALLRLGRFHVVGQTIDDVKFRVCPACQPDEAKRLGL